MHWSEDKTLLGHNYDSRAVAEGGSVHDTMLPVTGLASLKVCTHLCREVRCTIRHFPRLPLTLIVPGASKMVQNEELCKFLDRYVSTNIALGMSPLVRDYSFKICSPIWLNEQGLS